VDIMLQYLGITGLTKLHLTNQFFNLVFLKKRFFGKIAR